MPINLCIFEDEQFSWLYPLTLTHPVYDLRCGILLLREKIAQRFPGCSLHLLCRDYLAESLRETTAHIEVNKIPPPPCLFVNGRFIFREKLPAPGAHDMVWKQNGEVAAAWIGAARLSALSQQHGGVISTSWFDGLPAEGIEGIFVRYPWDLIHHNIDQIKSDFAFLNRGGQLLGKIYPNVVLLEDKNIHLGAGSKIKPGAVIDAEDGPIYIGEGSTIMANASLQGPVFVGAKSVIKMGAKIYEGTTIGEVCKIGGEVEESIIHSYSNKQHEGFLGHSYLGQWVNIGADSNNSDLKNNYSTVKVHVNGKLIDSGLLLVGLTMGDHSKCGINAMFNTGAVVGVMSNVFGAGYSDKFVPSFSWGGMESWEAYALDKALDTARRVMARRGRELTQAQENVLRHVFELTEHERRTAIKQAN